MRTSLYLQSLARGHETETWEYFVFIAVRMDYRQGKLSYEECFADDESDCGVRLVSRGRKHNQRLLGRSYPITSHSTEENECVFDSEWALKRRCSLSSLIYSKFLTRLDDRTKNIQR